MNARSDRPAMWTAIGAWRFANGSVDAGLRAAAVEAAVDTLIREARARALEEAAAAVERETNVTAHNTAGWLRDRAARERGAK